MFGGEIPRKVLGCVGTGVKQMFEWTVRYVAICVTMCLLHGMSLSTYRVLTLKRLEIDMI
jgi:hypothetical protein